MEKGHFGGYTGNARHSRKEEMIHDRELISDAKKQLHHADQDYKHDSPAHRALVGNQDKLPGHLKKAISDAPAQMNADLAYDPVNDRADSPVNNSGLGPKTVDTPMFNLNKGYTPLKNRDGVAAVFDKNLKILTDFNETDSTYLSKPAKNKISIRHLLTHTSGIGYGLVDNDPRFKAMYKKHGIVDLFTTDSINIESNVKKLAQLPLHHEPGEAFTYGESLDVLGYFIEVISQKSLDVFFKERIFEPLEMKDTYFYLPTTHQDRLVPVQTKKDGFWTKYQGDFYDTNFPVKGAKTFLSGGAGLSSTTADYSNFLQMFLNKGSFNGCLLYTSPSPRDS